MASKKSAKKKPAKKTKKAAKRSAARRPARKAAKRPAARPPARKAAKRSAPRPARKAAAPRPPAPPKIRQGLITHTELASGDPEATLSWCASVLGWKFGEAMPTPAGPYHMWRFPNDTGGGIRANNPPEVPGSIPYVEVTNIQATYDTALEKGATPMMPPEALPGGMGWIAIVAAPGGVPIGFWSMK
jgi:uncharacterized protein